MENQFSTYGYVELFFFSNPDKLHHNFKTACMYSVSLCWILNFARKAVCYDCIYLKLKVFLYFKQTDDVSTFSDSLSKTELYSLMTRTMRSNSVYIPGIGGKEINCSYAEGPIDPFLPLMFEFDDGELFITMKSGMHSETQKASKVLTENFSIHLTFYE